MTQTLFPLTHQAKATSFATRQDLAAFAICVSSGGSVQHCLSVGDNGLGAWQQATWKPYGQPIVALPRELARKDAAVRVQLSQGHGRVFIAYCRDIAPAGVIDLNPAALRAAGLAEDFDLCDMLASWEFCDQTSAA